MQKKTVTSERPFYESVTNLSESLGCLNMGIWWINVKSNHIEISPTLANLCGAKETKWNKPDFITSFIHPEDRGLFEQNITEQLKTHKAIYHEFRIMHPDGTIRWFYTQNAFVFDKDGKLLFLYGIVGDKTESKRREKQLQFLASISRLLVESFEKTDMIKRVAELTVHQIAEECAVRLIDVNGKLHINVILFRDPEKQKVIERLSKIPVNTEVMPEEIKEVMQNKNVQINNKMHVLCNIDSNIPKNSHTQYGDFSSADIPLLAKGEAIGVLSIISDKSKWHFDEADREFLQDLGAQIALSVENTRLYNEAQRAVKLREDILAIVSHDLRNPLFTIQMAGEVIPKIANDQSKIISFSKKILRSTEQMKRMIEDLMDFAKIQEGNLSIEKNQEDPNVLINEACDSMKAQAEKKGVILSAEINSKIPFIKLDRLRMIQALSNLISNAINFTNSGGSIVLSTCKTGDKIRFSVSDTGCGISQEDRPKIFNRYWQSKKCRSAGAGLGLSITKGIIEAHGGEIYVESKPGEGSVFYFALPIV